MRAPISLCASLFLLGCSDTGGPVVPSFGDAAQGRVLIERVGCAVCHDIPGIRGPDGIVGPSLSGFSRRAYFAGSLPNRPGLVAQFVRDAPSLAPKTAMPDMPLDEQQARDVAAYLHTLR